MSNPTQSIQADGLAVLFSFLRRFRRPVAVCLLIILTWSAFNGVLGNDFIDFDDTEYIVDNPYVRMGLTGQSVRWAFTTVFLGNWHPLTMLSHMLDVELFGLQPAGHHLSSLLLHMAAAAVLFEWLRKSTGCFWASFAAALFFAVHPLRVESVAWAAERKDILCGLWGILALWAYGTYTQKRTLFRYGLVLLCLLLGLLSKGMLVTWPLLFLLLDVWPYQRTERWTLRIAEKIPFFLICLAFSILMYWMQKQGGAQTDWTVFPFLNRLDNAAFSYLRYIAKTIYPAGLAVLYPLRPDFSPLRLVLSLAALGLVSVYAVRVRRTQPWIFTGWFWYLLTLLPVIGLVQIGRQSMADRYTYLPSIGLAIAVFYSIHRWTSGHRIRSAIAVGAVAVAFAFWMTATWVQTARWQNTITLFEHSIRVTGDNPTLEVNLAYRLAKLGELDRAIHITESVFQRYPSYSQCALNLSSFFMQKKDFDRALEYLQKALALRPDRQDQILAYQGIVLKKAGRIQEAQRAFEQSLQINPNQPTALSELGEILFLQGRRTDGIALWEKALQTDPFSLKALENLAWTLAVCCQESVHNPKKAFAYAQRLAAAGPPTAKQMDILAAALAACGDYEAAVRRAQEALNLAETEPNAPSAEAIQERLTLYQNQKRFLDTSCGLWIQ